MFDSRSSSTHSGSSPQYGPFDKDLLVTLGSGTALMLVTLAGMLLTAFTPAAEAFRLAYSIPLVGVLIFGALLTAGRHFGIKGIENGNLGMGFLGAGLSIAVYSVLGGGILSMFAPGLYIPALVITGGITVAITLVAALYVYLTDKDLSQWAAYSSASFIGGLVMVFVGTFIPILLIVGFFLFLIGFLCDLVYEIWMVSQENRSPVANGLALYIAFAGVFVHILQLVLRMLAEE